MEKMKKLFQNYKDVIPYLFFGVCTTFVNVIIYWGTAHLMKVDVMISAFIAWGMAVIFAYITNRRWVFHSSSFGIKDTIREIISFFVFRLATGIVDLLCMYIFVDILNFNDVIIKIVANILVITLNYLASKLVIFR